MALKLDLSTEELKIYLRVEHNADDKLIEKFKKAAISELDSFLNNDFSDYQEQPPELEIWVMNRVATYYENRQGNVPEPDFSSVERYRKYPMANILEDEN